MAASSSWKIKFQHFEQGRSATVRLVRRMSPCAGPRGIIDKVSSGEDGTK